MKIYTKQAQHRGIIICIKIGDRINESWWSSPPDSCDHVGLHYLNDRYPLITTEKRMKDFKVKFKDIMKDVGDDI